MVAWQLSRWYRCDTIEFVISAPIAEVLERLANLLRQRQHEVAVAHGLNGAQVSALLYLAKANSYSDTPVAVAEYLGLTKGTVSQTLLVLERGGWLRRKADRTDGRVVHLQLTPRALRLAAECRAPLDPLAALPQAAESAAAMISVLQRANGGRAFGVCHTCRHFRRDGPEAFRCGLTLESLAPAQTFRICREHEEPRAA